ncbi:DNA repair protein RecO [Alkalihalobacillus sp. APA_J-10(15)]|nr:DNA repair protein RecO [Halalkalibacter sp. APA_J-10(15)]MCK0471559.1 DNA repair protein RecO [Halalkalibacter sp. APA_J-10(15)]
MMQKVEGIIIRTIDYGETNKVVTLFTKELGKIGVMARGAKKPKSRLSAASQLFMYGIFVIQTSSGLGVLQQADITSSFRDIRSDLRRAAHASYMLELTDKLTDEKTRYSEIFKLLYQILIYIDEGLDVDVLKMIFETKMLAVAGIKPELDQCSSCGSINQPIAFSIKNAGFLCPKCRNKDPHAFQLNPQHVKLLRLFYYVDLERLGHISLKNETKKYIQMIIDSYYQEYSGLRLKSKRFLEQLERFDLNE